MLSPKFTNIVGENCITLVRGYQLAINSAAAITLS